MRKILTTAATLILGLMTLGLIGLTTQSTAVADDSPFTKRDDDTVQLVLAGDDDDDDDDTNGNTNTNTGNSASTRDNTNSKFSKVSRNRDLSRSDKTKDFTRDGKGKMKRDFSANQTNDRSRNDTRR